MNYAIFLILKHSIGREIFILLTDNKTDYIYMINFK